MTPSQRNETLQCWYGFGTYPRRFRDGVIALVGWDRREGPAELQTQAAYDVAYRHLARDFARRMTTHAVGHDEDPAIGNHEVAVLIPRPDDSDVGATCGGDVHVIPK